MDLRLVIISLVIDESAATARTTCTSVQEVLAWLLGPTRKLLIPKQDLVIVIQFVNRDWVKGGTDLPLVIVRHEDLACMRHG